MLHWRCVQGERGAHPRAPVKLGLALTGLASPGGLGKDLTFIFIMNEVCLRVRFWMK